MEITFTRGEAGAYAATVSRDDGVVLHIPGGDRKHSVPHDLAHFIVEQGLGLRNGFWGRVARGAIYPGMKVLAGRQPPHAAERSREAIRDGKQQDVEAEVLVGVLYAIMRENLENDEAAVHARLSREWRPNQPERELPNAEEVRRVCAALRTAEQEWAGLEPGQSLTVQWPARRGVAHRPARKR